MTLPLPQYCLFAPDRSKPEISTITVTRPDTGLQTSPNHSLATEQCKLSNSVLSLDREVRLRGADALHLCCAKQHGYRTIHSNDRHLLAAAGHFGLRGRNVVP